MERTVDHRISNLARTKQILNGKMETPLTARELLALEEKRLGVKFEIVTKGDENDSSL
jgi:hypothetical protein